MTKKDFKAIAEVISNLPMDDEGYIHISHLNLAIAFMPILKASNPNFDRGRFSKACMPKVPVK